MLQRFALGLVVVLTLSCASAPPAMEGKPGHGAPADAPLVANGAAQLGDKTKCPVSGEEFVVSADSPKTEHGGKTYYFCCAHCAEKFKAAPDKFAGGA